MRGRQLKVKICYLFMLAYNYYGSKSLTNLHFFHQNILLVTL